MNITFLGATRQVTGSNYLVEAAGKKFLVDCGLHQGSMEEYQNYIKMVSEDLYMLLKRHVNCAQ